MNKVNRQKKIKVTVEKTSTGFSAYAEGFPVFTTGDSATELVKNMQEALNLYFEEEGKSVSQNQITLNFDFELFFRYYRVLNAKFLSERIGMNPTLLSQYVRGQKKPSAKQTEKILKGIRQIGRELSELHFS
jgi:predicted RNase H-like HicB family nuclease